MCCASIWIQIHTFDVYFDRNKKLEASFLKNRLSFAKRLPVVKQVALAAAISCFSFFADESKQKKWLSNGLVIAAIFFSLNLVLSQRR